MGFVVHLLLWTGHRQPGLKSAWQRVVDLLLASVKRYLHGKHRCVTWLSNVPSTKGRKLLSTAVFGEELHITGSAIPGDLRTPDGSANRTVGVTHVFTGDAAKQTQWKAFRRRNGLEVRLSLEGIVGRAPQLSAETPWGGSGRHPLYRKVASGRPLAGLTKGSGRDQALFAEGFGGQKGTAAKRGRNAGTLGPA